MTRSHLLIISACVFIYSTSQSFADPLSNTQLSVINSPNFLNDPTLSAAEIDQRARTVLEMLKKMERGAKNQSEIDKRIKAVSRTVCDGCESGGAQPRSSSALNLDMPSDIKIDDPAQAPEH